VSTGTKVCQGMTGIDTIRTVSRSLIEDYGPHYQRVEQCQVAKIRLKIQHIPVRCRRQDVPAYLSQSL